jgi:hypothetical protein
MCGGCAPAYSGNIGNTDLSIPVMPERGWPQEKFAAFFIYKLWGKHYVSFWLPNFHN